MKKLLTVVVLVIVSGSALFAGGCAANGNDKPYSLTGDSSTYPQTWPERQRYTDQKGHYHPEWVGQNSR